MGQSFGRKVSRKISQLSPKVFHFLCSIMLCLPIASTPLRCKRISEKILNCFSEKNHWILDRLQVNFHFLKLMSNWIAGNTLSEMDNKQHFLCSEKISYNFFAKKSSSNGLTGWKASTSVLDLFLRNNLRQNMKV